MTANELAKLFAELRYQQCMNRVAAKQLQLGQARVRQLAAVIRAYSPTAIRRARKRAPTC